MSLAEKKDMGRRGEDAKPLFGQAESDMPSGSLDVRAWGPGEWSGLQGEIWHL